MKALTFLLASALLLPSLANADTLTKVSDTKKIFLGVRDVSPPLSYTLGPGKYTGYHVEICERLVARLQKHLKLDALNIEYAPVTSQNRMPLVQNGTVDLECGTTTNNATRQKDVSFALTTYITEIRMATKVSSGITSVAQLSGKTVAMTTGSTGVQALRKHRRASNLDIKDISGKDHSDSFLLLESGRADAMVIDDNILAGLIAVSKSPAAYHIVGEVLNVEPIAIMFRKDEPALKKFMDDELAAMMKSGEVAELYNKWFVQPIPPRGARVNLPMSESLKQALAKPNDKPAETYQEAKN